VVADLIVVAEVFAVDVKKDVDVVLEVVVDFLEDVDVVPDLVDAEVVLDLPEEVEVEVEEVDGLIEVEEVDSRAGLIMEVEPMSPTLMLEKMTRGDGVSASTTV